MVIKLEDWRIEEITGYKPITTFYEDMVSKYIDNE